MAENARPPVAVRIVRPYDTEEAFLEAELETVGKTSVILIGAHSRPTGVILRFEVTLQTGATVLRGEGRVLAHKEAAFRGQPGLALRFTRLDPKSKGLVDRAGQIREARLNGGDSIRPGVTVPPPVPTPAPESVAPRPVRTSSVPPSVQPRSSHPTAPPRSIPPAADPALTGALTSPTPVPPRPVSKLPSMPPPIDVPPSVPPAADAPDDSGPQLEVMELSSDAIPLSVRDFVSEPEPAPAPARPESEAPEPVVAVEVPSPPPAKSDRDLLLARLRSRAAGLTDEQRAAVMKRT